MSIQNSVFFGFCFSLVAFAMAGLSYSEENAGLRGREVGEGGVCLCYLYFDPQCGVNGFTFFNPCFAECEGVEIASPGPCPELRTFELQEHCGPEDLCNIM